MIGKHLDKLALIAEINDLYMPPRMCREDGSVSKLYPIPEHHGKVSL